MIYTTSLFASVVVAVVGILILWANPRRAVNRTVFVSSANVATWLALWHLAVISPENGLFLLRLTCAVGALAPLSLWLVKESILTTLQFNDIGWLRRNAFWFVGPIVLAVVPFSGSFIPSHSTESQRIRGWAYTAYHIGLFGAYVWLLRDAVRSMKALTGARRLELQVWLGGGCIVGALIYILIGLSAVTRDPTYRTLQPLAVLLFYVGTGYAISSHRIFDARQILLVGLEKATLIAITASVAYLLNNILLLAVSDTLALLVTSVAVLWIGALLNGWLDRKFQFLPQGVAARQAAFAAAQRETRVDTLVNSFCSLLKGWGQTEHAVILSGTKELLSGSGIAIAGDNVVIRSMKQLGWVTPERLTRERTTPERVAVGEFLSAHALGALVFEEGHALTVLVGLAVGAARRPFTYPQVTQLMELASIMHGALERAHYAVKVQHAEQLATVGLLGASLAHEIRNPLVSIKTFVQLLPTHYQDPVFREKFFRLIGDEVGRIDQLTEQLLDLASPRAYSAQVVELHPVLRASLDLVAAKASDKRIALVTEFGASPDRAFTDASAAKQVVLNLCFNAIHSVDSRGGEERWVRIATRNTQTGIEMAVADSGLGISEEILPRLFQPFQTTKSSGFGLGLAICSDILANLNATITVDPPAPGCGATFRVTFPCQPLSS